VDTAPGSWFIDQIVEQDGRLLVATHMDPLFALLPFLLGARRSAKPDATGLFCSLPVRARAFVRACVRVSLGGRGPAGHLGPPTHRCRPERVQEVLSSLPQFPDASVLLGCAGLREQVRNVCQVKQGWDEAVYRLDDALVLQWLRAKHEQLAAALPEEDGGDDASRTRRALLLLSEYVCDPFLDQLLASHGCVHRTSRALAVGDPRTALRRASPPQGEPCRAGGAGAQAGSRGGRGRQGHARRRHQCGASPHRQALATARASWLRGTVQRAPPAAAAAKKKAPPSKLAAASKGTRPLTAYFTKKS
jgi:hypothetical protein